MPEASGMLETYRETAPLRRTAPGPDVFGLGPFSRGMSEPDIDPSEFLDGADNELKTSIPGVTVTTRLADADTDELEEVHRRQLEFALEHAEDAKNASRM